jgi:hypothetical protein
MTDVQVSLQFEEAGKKLRNTDKNIFLRQRMEDQNQQDSKAREDGCMGEEEENGI